MRFWFNILRAHFAVEFTMLFRYPFDLASLYVIVTMVLAGIFMGINAFVPAGSLMGSTKAAVFIGYFFWTFYLLTVQSASWEITMASNQGYLEREFLTPAGHGPTVVAKILANSAAGLIHYVVIAVLCILILRVEIALDAPSVLVVFAISYFFLVGVGLAFAGLALVFKRIGSAISIFQMVLLVLSFTALGKYGPAVEHVMRWFPYTQGIRLLRGILVDGRGLAYVLQPANVLPFAAGTAFFFVGGWVAFFLLDRAAADRGLIGQF